MNGRRSEGTGAKLSTSVRENPEETHVRVIQAERIAAVK
jgi:hypothetical protein